jgi:hypothetical protein
MPRNLFLLKIALIFFVFYVAYLFRKPLFVDLDLDECADSFCKGESFDHILIRFTLYFPLALTSVIALIDLFNGFKPSVGSRVFKWISYILVISIHVGLIRNGLWHSILSPSIYFESPIVEYTTPWSSGFFIGEFMLFIPWIGSLLSLASYLGLKLKRPDFFPPNRFYSSV